jgi:hypothetical protein
MRILILALAVAAAGCAGMLPGAAHDPAAADAAMGEALAAVRAPAAEQRAALARAQQRFEGESTAVNKLRLATLLVLLPAPLRDDARAAELLEPLSDSASPGIGRFAAFLASQVSDRQRAQREAERLARESERQARERERADRERDRLDKERDKREEALRQQLEALRSIERGILEREERLRRRQR